ncbi:hypothetical protein C8Q70DRAFT_1000214 [Cubamyces menziesii]|uniref:F-box domain-containing protein n=1 Tax=Trametes cubensis TaxID=1111947 RepID=A0AAD7U5W9_9APHY|nr:hypothetical protein C8Q70DRAFT_1000214 [Cubamyces menziesii]KAJ8501797.1 hypothetical protein ONZ51_g420 [Trametes cubensis]
MTSALHIPSVLSTVCLSLIPPRHELFTPNYIQKNAADLERRKEGCRTLACLARVCKAFTNPTLDVLWRDVPSVDVLLKVLPCLQHDPGIQHVQYTILDDISAVQWDRLQFYAGLIRALHQAYPLQALSIQRVVWAVIKQRCCGRPLLPNLQTLELRHIDISDPVGLTLLLSPSLRTVVLSFSRANGTMRHRRLQPLIPASPIPTHFEALVQLIGSTLPHLTRLQVLNLPGSLPSHCMSYLTRLHQLHRIELGIDTAADYHVLQCLSRFPSLRTLSVAVVLREEDREQELDLGPGFLGLEELHLNGRAEDLVAVIQVSSFLALRSLSLEICTVDSPDAFMDDFAVICSRVPKSISKIDLAVSMNYGFEPISLTTLVKPVLSWGAVTVFKVQTDNYAPILDNDDLRSFAEAWPHLVDFELRPTNEDNSQGVKHPKVYVTITGLIDLAQRCPRLRSLTIPALDIAELPDIRDVPPLNRRDLSRLQIKDLMRTDSANLMTVAIILDLLFPCVSTRRSVEAAYVQRHSYYYMLHIDNRVFDFLLILMGTIAARRECDRISIP